MVVLFFTKLYSPDSMSRPPFSNESPRVNQVLGRDLALFSVVTAFPDTRGSLWVLMMFAAWAASEVIR